MSHSEYRASLQQHMTGVSHYKYFLSVVKCLAEREALVQH